MCRTAIQGDPLGLTNTKQRLTDYTRRLIECCGGQLVNDGVQVKEQSQQHTGFVLVVNFSLFFICFVTSPTPESYENKNNKFVLRRAFDSGFLEGNL